VRRQKCLTRSDRDVRIALGKYGLKPAEALLANKVVVVEGPNDVTFVRTLVELHTGFTADRQDILVISAGGKGPVGDLSGFLSELGAKWQAFFDWDATESTSAPLFKDGLAIEECVKLQEAATRIRAHLRNQPTKNSKATKIVDSMLNELANPQAAAPGFVGSILEKFMKKNALLAASEMTALAEAIRKRRRKSIAKLLSPKNTWLWSGTIEQVILRSAAAETDTEAVLRRRGVLTRNFVNPSDRLPFLMKMLHDSAHEPELVRDVVETLWRAGHFDNSEAKAAVKFVVG
jgi:hypothetical protein